MLSLHLIYAIIYCSDVSLMTSVLLQDNNSRGEQEHSPRVDVVDAVGGHVGVAVNLQETQHHIKKRQTLMGATEKSHHNKTIFFSF